MQYEYFRDSHEYFAMGLCVAYGHFHRAIELLYCIETPKPISIDGVEMTVGEGELLFVPPFAYHKFPRIEPHKALCVVLPITYTDLFEKQTVNQRLTNLIFTDKALAADIYAHLLQLKNAKNPLLRSGIYNYCLGKVLENAVLTARESKRENDFVIRTLTYLETHYTEKLTLEAVARDLGYNRCYFSTLFSQSFHSNFCTYLNTMRINKSLQLLSEHSIAEVAERVGFCNLQSYYTHFKRIVGQPPAAWLSACKN